MVHNIEFSSVSSCKTRSKSSSKKFDVFPLEVTMTKKDNCPPIGGQLSFYSNPIQYWISDVFYVLKGNNNIAEQKKSSCPHYGGQLSFN